MLYPINLVLLHQYAAPHIIDLTLSICFIHNQYAIPYQFVFSPNNMLYPINLVLPYQFDFTLSICYTLAICFFP